MLKRVVSLIVGVCCLLTMTGAFAAMTYTGTTTEYVAGDNSKIQVTSYVTGEANDVATYLVYGNTAGDDTLAEDGSNIVYVDQYKFASAGTWEISYQTAATNVNADIKLASTISPVDNPETEIPAAAAAVNITVTDGTTTYATLAVLPTATAYGWYEISYLNSAQAVVSAVSVDGVAVDPEDWFTGIDTLYLSSDVALDEQSEIMITVDDAAATASTTSMTYLDDKADTMDTEGTGLESVVMVGKVTGNVQEFGMILANSKEAVKDFVTALESDANATSANAQKLKAAAKNDQGEFAIRVYDEVGFANGILYAITYYIDAQGVHVANMGCSYEINKGLPSEVSLSADDEVFVVEDAAIEE